MDLSARLQLLADAVGRHVGHPLNVQELITRAPVDRSARLYELADGWLAVNLARPSDLASIPAWLGCEAADLEAVLRTRKVAPTLETARLLALPVGAVGEAAYVPPPVRFTRRPGEAPPMDTLPLVVDLSAMWAGPLCGALLADSGFRVIKIETPDRPDGLKVGDPLLFTRLNDGKEHRTLSLRDPELVRLLDIADVVIEGSRPRALEQVGLGPDRNGAGVWLSITAYGREHPDRVGFGDDAAAAAGLVTWVDGRPGFVGDAIADPTTGLLGALAVHSAHRCGGRWLLDAALSRSAGWLMC